MDQYIVYLYRQGLHWHAQVAACLSKGNKVLCEETSLTKVGATKKAYRLINSLDGCPNVTISERIA